MLRIRFYRPEDIRNKLFGMRNRDVINLLVSCLSLCFFSCREKSNKIEAEVEIINIEPQRDVTREAMIFVDSLLTTMTLEERAGQCLMPSIYTTADAATLTLLKKYIDDYHIGGVVLLRGNMASAGKIAEIGKESKIPLFISIDAEWGLGMRLEDAKTYPKNGSIGDHVEESALFDYGREISRECKSVGINMVLGPVVDITDVRKGVIGKRSFGRDPQRVSNYGIAYAKGLESGGVISVAKHFPGHGSTIKDSHKGTVKIERNITALDSLDLKPFREYVNAGLSGVMAGHIQAPALDPDGNAASVSIDMLTSLLRDEMEFKGLVLTDAFDMGGANGFTAVEALKAGADLILSPRKVEKEYSEILSKVKNGDLDVQILNERCKRILFYKYLFGLFNKEQ